jgi:D-amino-acid dehydrogenase
LPRIMPWLWQYFRESSEEKLLETAKAMRPLFERSLWDHRRLMKCCDALEHLNINGWMHVYRTREAFDEQKRQLELTSEAGIKYEILDPLQMRDLEPALKPNFYRAILWTASANVRSPVKLTEAYARRFRELGGVNVLSRIIPGRNLHGPGDQWLVETDKMDYQAKTLVVALGPWMPDFLRYYRLDLPFAVKRGYHHHFPISPTCTLSRPVVDDLGYCMAEQEQGIRLTTGAEFADRDAPPTPVQFDRLMPGARELLDLGEPLEKEPWMGCRPCLPDSRPIIGKVPSIPNMWIAGGHGHKGLTLSATTGFLMADLIMGTRPFCDPKHYSAERYL